MTLMLLLFGAVLALIVAQRADRVALGIVRVAAMVTSHGLILPNWAIVRVQRATSFPLLAIPRSSRRQRS